MASATSRRPQVPALTRLAAGLRRHWWSLATVLGVTLALGCTVWIVRVHADEKDALRRAEIALAGAPSPLEGVVASPEALLEGAPAAPSEYPLNELRRNQLARAVLGVSRYWHASTAALLRAEAGLLDARSRTLMGLIAAHRLKQGNELHDLYIQPLNERLKREIVLAERQLGGLTRSADQSAWRATLGTVLVSGALLVMLIFGMVWTRRRQLGSELERAALRLTEQRLRALVEHGSDMISVVAPDSTVVYQAGAVSSMLGYEPGQLEGRRLAEWLDPQDLGVLAELCATRDSAKGEVRVRHRDGAFRTLEIHATNLGADSPWAGVVLNVWDLSDRKALEEGLRHQAFHDALTGLPNRALLMDRAEQMMARARRGRSIVAALYVDLDGFKAVNDCLGHAAGDCLLRLVAERLNGVTRDQDTVARLGGDEFILLLDANPANAPAAVIGQRILDVFTAPFELDAGGEALTITASIGLAIAHSGTIDELLRDADLALYEAKRAGRNRLIIFDAGMHTAANERLRLEGDLQHALEREQLFLIYQPAVDLNTQELVGVEALIRWRHPTDGVIGPDVFLPIAEQSALIVDIGRWVLEEACCQAASWHHAGQVIGMSVNVSARQLHDEGLEEDVANALARSHIDPEAITLEIAETALMQDIEAAGERLAALTQLGIRIAIDDYGTGGSSLACLQDLPIDLLKIDRRFIAGIETSESADAAVGALVQMGHALGVKTLAEGIEKQSQLRQLQLHGCELGQGYLFARPLDPRRIEEYRGHAASSPSGSAAGRAL